LSLWQHPELLGVPDLIHDVARLQHQDGLPAAPGSARPADNHSVITEFLVDDVDRVHQNLTGFVTDFATGPTTMPWGLRSLLFRDPGNWSISHPRPQRPSRSSHVDATHSRSPHKP
jgi:hypothetical protein